MSSRGQSRKSNKSQKEDPEAGDDNKSKVEDEEDINNRPPEDSDEEEFQALAGVRISSNSEETEEASRDNSS